MSYREFIQQVRESRSNVWFLGSERHHILPRCMGGTDDEDNLIYLTPQEHFTAHRLLVEENPDDSKLVYALFRMCDGKRNVTDKEYSEIKFKMAKHMSEEFSGEGNPFYGCHHTSESKRSMSETKRVMYTGEGNPFYGKSHSPESRQKMSLSHSEQKWVHKDGREITVYDKEKYAEMIESGWSPGRLSENFTGSKNPFYGKKHSEETRKKIGESMSRINKGRVHSEETKQKIREKFKTRVYTKICKSCGKEFTCRGANTKYCIACKKK